jgi:3-isopropylmalate/(R)-2-methylmalate dehydratase small subunit
MTDKIIKGKAYVLDDKIDTDQIIPACYLTLVPTIPEERVALGSHALSGLPDRYQRFIKEGETQCEYTFIVAGRDFGCGSSREHAPVALAAAGVKVIIAEAYARIFFRNCIMTGSLYPLEGPAGLNARVKNGDELTLDLEKNLLTLPSGETITLTPLGAAGEVIEAGGIFEFARKSGMISKKA